MIKIWVVSLLIFSSLTIAAEKKDSKSDMIHMFNRLSFGPRPNELKEFQSSKLSKTQWIESQLNPDKIDDHELDVKLSHIKSLDMEARDIINFYKKPEDLARDLGIKMDENNSKKDIRKEVRDAIGNERFPEALIIEMQAQKLIRAIESKKQLQEVLVDFWYNHFNVDVGKNEIKYVAYNYENEVIRKNVFKTFPEMLLASAQHPAMLVYLDNRLNRKKGINENYAREVMELHTLGVDGGYTQTDIQALASIFTGWSIKDFKENPRFEFNEKAHDKEEKVWLGQTFPKTTDQNGYKEGERALMFLAVHPKTAHHISQKLVAYFVDDNPPASLVKKCEDKFIATKGDLKEVYRTLFTSSEFWDPKYHQSKIKKPFQLIASSLRAMGGEVLNSADLQKSSKLMGEDLYRSGPPTGYKDEAGVWVNSGSMISRLQFALDLSSQKFSGVLVQWPQVNKKQTLDQQITSMTQDLGISPLGVVSGKIIKKELELESSHFADNEIKPSFIGKMSGMILGSPEFQRK